MSSNASLPGALLFERRKQVPWQFLVGATVITNRNETLLIECVIARNWPDGPIFQMADTQERYTMAAFQRGTFKEIYPRPDVLAAFATFSEGTPAQNAARPGTLHPPSICSLDLLIFDLDDTLVASDHLGRFRGKANSLNGDPIYRQSLAAQASSLTVLVDQSQLLQLRRDFPSLRLAIFTRAPRLYTEVLLETCFPQIRWDCVICYEDVPGKPKPDPDGIHRACQVTDARDLDRVALVGDSVHDVIAAYQAGVKAILLRTAWGRKEDARYDRERVHRAQALALHPDALLDHGTDLSHFLSYPGSQALALEGESLHGAGAREPRPLRLDRYVATGGASPSGARRDVIVQVGGRYFASHRPDCAYDFRRKQAGHASTRHVLEAKNGRPYPDNWVQLCIALILQYASADPTSAVLVCPIPARPGQANRLEAFVQRIALGLGKERTIRVDTTVLQYRAGVMPNKTLSKARRYANIREHLLVAQPAAVSGDRVFVVDDVTTSGATFFYADHYLREAGARDVFCFALTRTISSHFVHP